MIAHQSRFFYLNPVHPLVFATLAVITGIWIQSLYYYFIVGCLLTCLIVLVSFLLTKKSISTLYSLACLLGGATLYYQQKDFYQTVHCAIPSGEYTITGTVHDIDPAYGYNKWRMLISNCTLQLHNQSVQLISIPKKIAIYTTKNNNICVGDTLHIPRLTIKTPQEESIKPYFMREEIIATAFLNNNHHISITARPSLSIRRWLHTKKHDLYQRLQTKIRSPLFSLFTLLFLGFKQSNFHTEQHKEYFKYWGLSHFLARSGLHLVLFIMIWRFLLQCIPCWFLLKQIFFITISSIYFLLTWPTLSFERAFFTFLLYCLWIVCNQQINGLHILSVVTLLIIITNPIIIFFLDFQLSFGLTFALLWFNQIKWQQQIQLNSIIK